MALSRGIRVYEHDLQRKRVDRTNYNYYQGMNEIYDIKLDPSVEIFAVGTEGGAMVVHFRWRY